MKALLIDIDGLRPDVFSHALASGSIPHIAEILGGVDLKKGIQIPAVAPAPSITFCSQASLFTGTHPSQHGIPGNQFFDRFGFHTDGKPKFYAFDVGDTLAVDDAILVFKDGLASNCLGVPTIYERFSDWGWTSVVAGNMYAKGVDSWLKPSMVNIARFTKGGNLFGMDSAEYDRHVVEMAIDHINHREMPDLLTVYFLGLDHESHLRGPQIQLDHLSTVIDPLVGELWNNIRSLIPSTPFMAVIFSDHGQIQVLPDDAHSLRLAFPFEKEIGHLFESLGLDVHDFPGEDPNCDAVVGLNGGLAHVYLQNRQAKWNSIPDFNRDVIPIAEAFWDAHHSGMYAPELESSLSAVLVRNTQENGWHAPYLVLNPEKELLTLEEWFSMERQFNGKYSTDKYFDPIHRLNNLVGPFVGDMLLISNYAEGYYFGAPMTGVHGGLHPDDSSATMVFSFPNHDESESKEMQTAVSNAIQTRCQIEGGRHPSTVDLLTGLLAGLDFLS